MIVLDASAALEPVLRGADRPRLVDRVLRSGDTISAPHLLDLEVAQVLRRFVGAGELTESRAREALDDHLSLNIARYPHDEMLGRVWELSANCTAYDAAYLALAEALGALVVSFATRLSGVRGHRCRIEIITG